VDDVDGMASSTGNATFGELPGSNRKIRFLTAGRGWVATNVNLHVREHPAIGVLDIIVAERIHRDISSNFVICSTVLTGSSIHGVPSWLSIIPAPAIGLEESSENGTRVCESNRRLVQPTKSRLDSAYSSRGDTGEGVGGDAGEGVGGEGVSGQSSGAFIAQTQPEPLERVEPQTLVLSCVTNGKLVAGLS
jgi:hypothetical protein